LESFQLRPAENADSATIKSLVRQAGINPLGLDWERFLVAVDRENQVIGCVQIKPHRDGSRELASLVTRPDWRNQGVARSLIEQLLEKHPGMLYLMCRSELGPFYEKFGFRVLAEDAMPRYFRRIKRLTRLAEGLVGNELLLVMERQVARN
jgi:N-acetylglutamate synthase-like GNAT family acetyltransferase